MRKYREQSLWTVETSQEAQKRLKDQQQLHANIRQCETAEQRSRRLQVQNEGSARRSKHLATEERVRRLQVKVLLTLDVVKEELLLSNNATASNNSTYKTMAGLTLGRLLYTHKSGYRKKWLLFTCTRKLSSTDNATCARKPFFFNKYFILAKRVIWYKD